MDLMLHPEDFLKIALAIVAGGLIGIEREFRDKAAGFRTLIFICLGATLFTMLSTRLALDKDPTRIAANIVTGIGFLGAGVILRDQGRVIGLTTAATIWLTAAIGMGIGGGEYAVSFAMLGASLIVLWFFPTVEGWIDNMREERTYEIRCFTSATKFDELDKIFRASGLHVRGRRRHKIGEDMVFNWQVSGAPDKHEILMQKLFADPDIKEFRF